MHASVAATVRTEVVSSCLSPAFFLGLHHHLVGNKMYYCYYYYIIFHCTLRHVDRHTPAVHTHCGKYRRSYYVPFIFNGLADEKFGCLSRHHLKRLLKLLTWFHCSCVCLMSFIVWYFFPSCFIYSSSRFRITHILPSAASGLLTW